MMTDTAHMIGLTDEGRPIVPAEGICEHWMPGASPTVGRRECWYCRWADFRKTTEVTLKQSICRCPQNQMAVVRGGQNEDLQRSSTVVGGYRHD